MRSKKISIGNSQGAQAPLITLCFCSGGHESGHYHWAGCWPEGGGRCTGCGTVNDVHVYGCPNVAADRCA